MLNENAINALPEAICARLEAINTGYLESIGKRIKEIGEMKPTDINRAQIMYQCGVDADELTRQLANASGKNVKEIQDIFSLIAKENYEYSRPFFEAQGMEFIPFEENEPLQRYVESISRQTVGEYINLTQNTAFAVYDGSGRNVAPLFDANIGKAPTSLHDTYTKVIDQAVTTAQLGYTDYQSAMRMTLKALADSGIRTVDYATGYSRRLDSAVRQNILWAIKQCNQNTADMVGEQFGADGYEISYHGHPRPSHEAMGGRQYAIGKARTVNGVHYPSFNDVAHLLEDFGCLHFKFSILLGISEPAYDPEQLAAFKEADKQTFEFEGKKYTNYEASQVQRRLETAIRNQKDRANIAKAAGDDDMRRQAQEKINHLTSKYKKFSDASGLPTRVQRMSVSGFRRVKTKAELKANQSYDSEFIDRLRRGMKSVTSKEKVIGYNDFDEGYKNAFEAGLSRSHPSVKKLLKEMSLKADYINSSSRKSFYKPMANTVTINQKDPATLAHELFHMIQHKKNVDVNPFSTALQKDYSALLKVSGGNIEDYLKAKYPHAFSRKSVNGKTIIKREYGAISDIVSGMTNDNVNLGFHHEKEYWERGNNMLPREAWAGFGKILYSNNPEVIKMFTELFTNFNNSAIMTLKELI